MELFRTGGQMPDTNYIFMVNYYSVLRRIQKLLYDLNSSNIIRSEIFSLLL